MQHILVRDTARPPSSFADFISTATPDSGEIVNLPQPTPSGLRLVRNHTATPHAFAIAHYQADPNIRVQHASYFKPVNMDLVVSALEKHPYVFVGAVTSAITTTPVALLESIQYVTHDQSGKLIRLDAQEELTPTTPLAYSLLTPILGIIRMEGFPVHCVLTNPDVIRVTDDVEYYDSTRDTMWHLTPDHDGPLHNQIITPSVSSPAKLFGNNIVSKSPEFTFSLTSDASIYSYDKSPPNILEEANWTIDTNLSYTIHHNAIKFISPPTGSSGFFDLRFSCGGFFDLPRPHFRQYEHPSLSYIVTSI